MLKLEFNSISETHFDKDTSIEFAGMLFIKDL